MTKHVKSVSFNTKNEKDNLILKHISRRNFSGYIKKLILADIQKREEEKELKKETQKTPPERKVMGKGITKQIQPKPYIPKG